MKEAVQKAIDSGITIVAAAGNESTDEYSFPLLSKVSLVLVQQTNATNYQATQLRPVCGYCCTR